MKAWLFTAPHKPLEFLSAKRLDSLQARRALEVRAAALCHDGKK